MLDEASEVFGLVWVVWVGMFLVFETVAIVRKGRNDTFSETFRKWLRINHPNRWVRYAGRAVVVAFGVWLTAHMAFNF